MKKEFGAPGWERYITHSLQKPSQHADLQYRLTKTSTLPTTAQQGNNLSFFKRESRRSWNLSCTQNNLGKLSVLKSYIMPSNMHCCYILSGNTFFINILAKLI